jgi:branched-chain amino acid aminotransferase
MTFDQTKWVWRNGEIIPWGEATTHVSVHALHYGSGVFEGMRCYETCTGPAIFRLDAHLDRLYNSAAVHGMEIPYQHAELTEAVCDLIERNGFQSCYIRPLCYYGSNTLGLHPARCPVEVVILVWPWAPYLGAEGLERGVRVTVSPWVKFHSQMMPTTAKASGQYVNSILAVRDAVDRGFDEALLLDVDGHIAEGSGENLFVVRRGELLTNDERHSILLGITRDTVIQIGRDLGYQVKTGPISVSDLIDAGEAFFTGTAAEVTPIREVDGSLINGGLRGPVTTAIQNVFFSAVSGREEKYKEWLHFVVPRPVEIFG